MSKLADVVDLAEVAAAKARIEKILREYPEIQGRTRDYLSGLISDENETE